MKQIFPIEIIENSIELHRFQHLKKSRVIYAILLMSISFLILLTLIVKIDIYATSPGVISVDIHGDPLQLKLIQSGNSDNTQSVNLNISPESDLIVECFVSPLDITLLKLNDPVSFQVKAFQYDQWGMANGKIIQIDHQALMVKEKLKYKVICSFHETSVLLRNIPVNLKTGMTLTAKFKIAKRTVFQLLFDKLNDLHSLS
jgi:HlyD family secretion protein